MIDILSDPDPSVCFSGRPHRKRAFIGQMLKRAGLKSYTDKDGISYVAADT